MKYKNIVTISTPPTALKQICVVDMLTDEELAQAKKERPDLIFTLGRDLPEDVIDVPDNESSVFNLDNPKGISVHGMAMPVDLEDQFNKL